MDMKALPLGDPSFKKIIQRNQLYADKTKYIHEMLNVSDCCFLSRPRRFGKTLLLKTISELFQGDRELFKDLWIGAQSDFSFKRHPVLTFNMAYDKISTQNDLIDRIEDDLKDMGIEHDVVITKKSYGKILEQLLKGLSKKYGVGAVILVDEYDAPVTDHITNRNLALACRDILHDFYRAIKTSIDYVRFAFVTGITRFAMTAVDSGANNFLDISLNGQFAGICGFTRHEVDVLFEDRFEATLEILKAKGELPPSADVDDLKAKILEWYDGYNWLGEERVFNPYSILKFFLEKHLGSYWPSTGRPSHLSALIRDNQLDFHQPGLAVYPTQQVTKTELSDVGVVPILFHSGYLTVDKEIKIPRFANNLLVMEDAYTFKTPNSEVDLYLKADIFKDFFKLNNKFISDLSKNLPAALLQKDSKEVVRMFHDLLVSISYHQHPTANQEEQLDDPAERAQAEKFYHAILHASLLSAGFFILSETSGGEGRPDITLFLPNEVCVIIEMKYRYRDTTTKKVAGSASGARKLDKKKAKDKELSAALDFAEEQIRDRDYAGPYRAAKREVICLAVAIRGRTQVAARFLVTEATDGSSGS
ncbi:MAG: ATP-binding protein [Deltaproteobacteria bacterium]|nr:ATP-binding protein [Deltaproteobacteria bacterium]